MQVDDVESDPNTTRTGRKRGEDPHLSDAFLKKMYRSMVTQDSYHPRSMGEF